MAQPQHIPTRQHTTKTQNQARLHHAQSPIRALYDLRQPCCPHTRTDWNNPFLEVYLAREPDPRQPRALDFGH
jgi:hypothetical protein